MILHILIILNVLIKNGCPFYTVVDLLNYILKFYFSNYVHVNSMIDALSEAPVTYRMRGSFYKQAGGNVQRHGVFQRFQFVFQTGNHFQKIKNPNC